MAINQAFLGELEHEIVSTRKMLERVPDDKFTWQPHAKSMTFGRLAQHVAEIPGWFKETLQRDSLDVCPGGKPDESKPIANRKELLELFDKNIAAGRKALEGATDDAYMMKPWALLVNGKTIFSMPRVQVLRGFIMSHMIHHRGQLSVYLRLNNIAVPSIYGPSADEGDFS